MRKMLTLVCCLMLILSLSMTAIATANSTPEFELRDGIHFGDKKENVPSNFKGTIAGIERTECRFCYDSDDNLSGMFYMFPETHSRNEADDLYKNLQQNLVRKYGEPDFSGTTTAGLWALLPSNAFDEMMMHLAMASLMGESYDIVNESEWLVSDNGGYVVIDIYEFYTGGRTTKNYDVYIGYRFYTTAEVDLILAEEQAEADEIWKIIDNDL